MKAIQELPDKDLPDKDLPDKPALVDSSEPGVQPLQVVPHPSAVKAVDLDPVLDSAERVDLEAAVDWDLDLAANMVHSVAKEVGLVVKLDLRVDSAVDLVDNLEEKDLVDNLEEKDMVDDIEDKDLVDNMEDSMAEG